MNITILPTQTREEKLAELQAERMSLELTSKIISYADYAHKFLALATRFLELDAMSGYGRCMERYRHYLSHDNKINMN